MRRLLYLSAICILAGCASTPETIPPDLTPREFFQRAQEAVVEGENYATALLYYETFLERYPGNLQRVVEAEYEIAFIHYKTNELELARTQFQKLLDRYSAEGAEILPRWPKALAEKILLKIEGAAEPAETKSDSTATAAE